MGFNVSFQNLMYQVYKLESAGSQSKEYTIYDKKEKFD